MSDAGPHLRRLIAFVCALILSETTLFAVVTPLLPHYARDYGLSKAAAGLLVAAYPAGVLIGSLPAGILVSWLGARATVLVAIGLLAAATFAFGFGDSPLFLDVARFVQGLGGTCAWAGGFAWLIDAAPRERRGAVLGAGLAAGVGGGLLGPAVGAIAAATTPQLVFTATVIPWSLLALIALQLPVAAAGERQAIGALLSALRNDELRLCGWLVVVCGVGFGVISVLGPLRLHRFGAGTVVVGAVFLVSALAEASVSRLTGQASDRRGRHFPIMVGLALTALLFWLFTLPAEVLPLAGLIVALTCAVTTFWVPAVTLLSDVAEQVGLEQGLAIAMSNLAWAGGDMIGSGGGGAIAGAVGDALPPVLVTACATLGLAALWRGRSRHRARERVSGVRAVTER